MDRATSLPKDGAAREAQDVPESARRNARPPKPRRRKFVRWLLVLALAVVVIGGGFLVGGFFRFAGMVTAAEPATLTGADAIVVLTGGRERVKKALMLLEEGRANRLLISGVHPDTRPEQIVALTSSNPALFRCCVDLDRIANNTLENAAETAKWARSRHFDSLLVVTSAYHMPRAMLELRSVAPDLQLIPAKVQSADLPLERWYADPQTTRLLLREYVKYMLTWLRIGMVDGALS
ncbi:YdcF family protein [Stappia taiwanensis]|uniref:YdcF family protein n=1 Tax=Stappia taiwanensis TaxID=992267 RepID=A0A838XM03_9HYPH|nr:YdcF family protein [Stappia taiwanensis]MBA4611525.1 YdcF family protein [Stappia taiwanensis]GGE99581.1 hypothetical protein GCM10007285_29000 [Stappia taiwanensis]